MRFVLRMNYGEDVIWLLQDKAVNFQASSEADSTHEFEFAEVGECKAATCPEEKEKAITKGLRGIEICQIQ